MSRDDHLEARLRAFGETLDHETGEAIRPPTTAIDRNLPTIGRSRWWLLSAAAAILGIGFLVFSYSTVLFAPGAWIPVPGYDEPTSVELAVDEGGIPALLSVNYTWLQLFLGNQPGPIGVTSIAGCLFGGAYLVLAGVANWRIIAGSFVGTILTVLLFNAFGPADDPNFAVPWYWHMVLGGWAFGTMFLATDPVASASTNPGRWAYGIFIGAVSIVVRVTNPSYYDGMLFAILLGSIFAPLFDYVVIERNIKRRAKRLADAP